MRRSRRQRRQEDTPWHSLPKSPLNATIAFTSRETGPFEQYAIAQTNEERLITNYESEGKRMLLRWFLRTTRSGRILADGECPRRIHPHFAAQAKTAGAVKVRRPATTPIPTASTGVYERFIDSHFLRAGLSLTDLTCFTISVVSVVDPTGSGTFTCLIFIWW
jgi:hypothetical protein